MPYMRQTILIITEDVAKIQTLTGIIGKIYLTLYIAWMKSRLALTVLVLNPFYKITVLTSDVLRLGRDNLVYGQELSLINYADHRLKYLKIAGDLLKRINNQDKQLTQVAGINLTDVFANRLTIFLAYNYFVYEHLYQTLLRRLKPDRVLILGHSPHELIAVRVAKKENIKVILATWFNLSRLNQYLNDWLQNREYGLKITNFLKQSFLPKPSIKEFQKPLILSLDFHRHLKTLAPLYRYQKDKQLNPWLVTDINNLEPALKNANLEQAQSAFLATFLPEKDRRGVDDLTKRLEKLVAEIEPTDFWEKLSLQTASAFIKKSLVLSSLYLKAADKLFQEVKPKGLMVVSDARFLEQALSLVAKNKRMKSVLVSPNTLLDLAELSPYELTDKVTLVGEFIREKLLKQGLPAKKLSVVGDLSLENYATAVKDFDRHSVYQKLAIKEDKKIILLISFRPNWLIPEEEKEAFVRMAVESVKKIPDCVLVIKPHPTEKRYRVLTELKAWGLDDVIVSVNHQLELFNLLKASNAVLQTWSMTLFEAAMLNRPVISISPFKKDYDSFLPIIKAGGAVTVHNQKELDEWLKKLTVASPEREKQISRAKKATERFIKKPDGKVAQRVTKLLLEKS
jgi:UDP-N-acetylglucosamine 2-epimerase